MFRQSGAAGPSGIGQVLLRNGFVEEGCSRCAIMRPDGLHDLRVFARLELPADLD